MSNITDVPSEEKHRLLWAIVFALLFVSLSWVVPFTYYRVAATDSFFSIEHIDVEQVDDQHHQFIVQVWSREEQPVKATITLYRVEEGGTYHEVERFRESGFISEGNQEITVDLVYAEPLEDGVYVYEMTYEVHQEYNVEKSGSTESDSFVIENETTNTSSLSETTDE